MREAIPCEGASPGGGIEQDEEDLDLPHIRADRPVVRDAAGLCRRDGAGGQDLWGNESGPVRSGNLDGTGGASDVFAGETPCGVAINSAAGKIYWASWNAGLIRVGNLDGSGSASTVFSEAGANLCGVAVDPAAGKIYWANFTSDTIKVGNLNGSGSPHTLFSEPVEAPPAGWRSTPPRARSTGRTSSPTRSGLGT